MKPWIPLAAILCIAAAPQPHTGPAPAAKLGFGPLGGADAVRFTMDGPKGQSMVAQFLRAADGGADVTVRWAPSPHGEKHFHIEALDYRQAAEAADEALSTSGGDAGVCMDDSDQMLERVKGGQVRWMAGPLCSDDALNKARETLSTLLDSQGGPSLSIDGN